MGAEELLNTLMKMESSFDDDFDVSTLTEELYYSKMDAIKDNYQRSLEFPVAEDYIYTNYFK